MIAIVVSNVTSNSFQYACHIGPLVGPRSSLCFRFTKRTPDVVEIFEEQLQKHHVLSMFRTREDKQIMGLELLGISLGFAPSVIFLRAGV